ncbi:MAG: hypothetical protein QOF55_723, partial [Thermoleophilaceae bacterium]|nr:hypothetical protein [Thermoleophilaceae bacterium]
MRKSSKRTPMMVLLALAVSLALAVPGEAAAPTGLQNPGFESDLSGWDASIVHKGYEYADTVDPATCKVPDGICVITGDQFVVNDGQYDSSRTVTVAPVEGAKMVRLGGPFTFAGQRQPLDRYRLEQTFVVDPAKPVLDLNYNVFGWDYQGFDRLDFRVTLTDAAGDVIATQEQPGFGAGTNLKTTGWRSAKVDLTGYEGKQVHLLIDS